MFMVPQLTERQEWYEIDGMHGIEYVPYELVGDDVDSLADYSVQFGFPGTSIHVVAGYGVRMSAPGYLDCTEWEVYDELAEAKERVRDLAEEYEYH